MKNGKVQEAAERFDDRKQAACSTDLDAGAEMVGKDAIRLLLIGTEIDLDELFEVANQMASAALMALATGAPLPDIIRSMWVDGLLTGHFANDGKEKA